MNAMIPIVNPNMTDLTQSSKNGNALNSKDFKLTLDELLKGIKVNNEINPLLQLLLALNPMISANGQSSFQGDAIGIDSNMNQSDTAGTNVMQLLKSILNSNTAAIPIANTVPLNVQEMVNNNIPLPVETILSLLNNSMASGNSEDTGESTSLNQDSAKILLDSVIKAKTGDAKEDNQTQNIHALDEPIPANVEDNIQKTPIDKFKDINEINSADIPKQEDKDINNLKTVDLSKQANSLKNDLNIINTSFNTTDSKISDDKFSSTMAVPSKVPITDIIKQITEGTKFLVTDKSKGEAVINLKPPNLGKLLMEVMVDKNIVTARITAQNADIKEIIEANINQLKDSLNQQGMRVDNLMVSVDGGGLFDGSHQQGHERHQRYFFTDNDKSYKDYDFYSYVDKDHVDCIV